MNAASQAVESMRRGRPVVLADDLGVVRLAVPAAGVAAEDIAFLSEHGACLVAAVLPAARADALELPSQSPARPSGADFAVSVDLIGGGVTTGISAADRAATLRALADPASKAWTFCRPGHVHVVRCAGGGVLERRDAHHAALDLARLAGAGDCVAVDTLVERDGSLVSDGAAFAARHGLAYATVGQVAAARRDSADLVTLRASARLPVGGATFTMHGFASTYGSDEHVALTLGFLRNLPPELIRTHTHCWAGGVAGSLACTCRARLDESLEAVRAAGRGVVVVLETSRGAAGFQCAGDRRTDAAVTAQILDELHVSRSATALRPTRPMKIGRERRLVTTVSAPILELVAS